MPSFLFSLNVCSEAHTQFLVFAKQALYKRRFYLPALGLLLRPSYSTAPAGLDVNYIVQASLELPPSGRMQAGTTLGWGDVCGHSKHKSGT